jgi:hypothetical protein
VRDGQQFANVGACGCRVTVDESNIWYRTSLPRGEGAAVSHQCTNLQCGIEYQEHYKYYETNDGIWLQHYSRSRTNLNETSRNKIHGEVEMRQNPRHGDGMTAGCTRSWMIYKIPSEALCFQQVSDETHSTSTRQKD